MTIKTRFQLGEEFPHEGFVQAAINRHFSSLGFVAEEKGYPDLRCTHQVTKEQWHIEAKGETVDVGLDIRTGLGQLLQGMTNESIKYALAVPETDKFLKQLRRVPGWARQRLNLHWIIVRADGSMRIVSPDETALVEPVARLE
jgi:hypothetical protein